MVAAAVRNRLRRVNECVDESVQNVYILVGNFAWRQVDQLLEKLLENLIPAGDQEHHEAELILGDRAATVPRVFGVRLLLDYPCV